MKTTRCGRSPPNGGKLAQGAIHNGDNSAHRLNGFTVTHAFSIRGADTFWAKSTGFLGVIGKRSAAVDRFSRRGERLEDGRFSGA